MAQTCLIAHTLHAVRTKHSQTAPLYKSRASHTNPTWSLALHIRSVMAVVPPHAVGKQRTGDSQGEGTWRVKTWGGDKEYTGETGKFYKQDCFVVTTDIKGDSHIRQRIHKTSYRHKYLTLEFPLYGHQMLIMLPSARSARLGRGTVNSPSYNKLGNFHRNRRKRRMGLIERRTSRKRRPSPKKVFHSRIRPYVYADSAYDCTALMSFPSQSEWRMITI